MNIFDLTIDDKRSVALEEVRLSKENQQQIHQLIEEHQFIDQLHEYGLPVNNKIFLYGSSGCGKTTTAKAIATALGRPIIILNLSNVVCSRIGETSQNLKAVFDKAAREKAVLFLDEFDQIGKERGGDDRDVGEMRRLVNTLIQLIDYFPEKSLLIAASNQIDIIDKALIRRFQLRLRYQMPSVELLDEYYDQLLEKFPIEIRNIQRKYEISYAEAMDEAYTQVKSNLINKLKAELN